MKSAATKEKALSEINDFLNFLNLVRASTLEYKATIKDCRVNRLKFKKQQSHIALSCFNNEIEKQSNYI
jgi:hypothetical protein